MDWDLKQSALPPFLLIRDFGRQNTRRNVSKIFVSLACYNDRSDRNPPITSASMTFWPSLRHASGLSDWWISIRSVDNVYDWRKSWKRLRVCFVFQSRLSTKAVVHVSADDTCTFVFIWASKIRPGPLWYRGELFLLLLVSHIHVIPLSE